MVKSACNPALLCRERMEKENIIWVTQIWVSTNKKWEVPSERFDVIGKGSGRKIQKLAQQTESGGRDGMFWSTTLYELICASTGLISSATLLADNSVESIFHHHAQGRAYWMFTKFFPPGSQGSRCVGLIQLDEGVVKTLDAFKSANLEGNTSCQLSVVKLSRARIKGLCRGIYYFASSGS